MKIAIIYWSKTGNTEKVALAIKDAVKDSVNKVLFKRTEDSGDIDFYDYDLICIGFPSHQWQPPKPVDSYLRSKYNDYRKKGRIKVGAPKIPGKNVLIFCTYSGPHTGINEAIPAGKSVGQFFEHLGFTILDEWYILGEFHGSEELSTQGRMGDIRGKPSEEDLRKIKLDMEKLLQRL